MHEPRSWVPDTASADGAARLLGDAVGGWSHEWFARHPLAAGALGRAVPRPLEGTRWIGHDVGFRIGMPLAGVTQLGAQALGLERGEAWRPREVAILDGVGAQCLRSLEQRFEALLDLPSGGEWTESAGASVEPAPTHWMDVTDARRRPVAMLALTASCLAMLVRRALPAATARPALSAPVGVLAQLPVTVGARLGRCRVTLAELQGLAAGDVLILDRAVGEALPLTIDHVVAACGRGAVIEQDARPALKILEPFGG